VFMRRERKFFIFNLSTVANQRVPTSLALITGQVESLLLRHCSDVQSGEILYRTFRRHPWAKRVF
jgi:hypothetical protein